MDGSLVRIIVCNKTNLYPEHLLQNEQSDAPSIMSNEINLLPGSGLIILKNNIASCSCYWFLLLADCALGHGHSQINLGK
jgi:GTPase SAR1 family protein